MVEFRPLALDGLVELRPARNGDARGFFSETWKEEWNGELGFAGSFVQDNHSLSGQAGVLRGLHLQVAPAAQDKLVRVVRGAVFDVAVDVRKGSPTYGRWAGLRLSAEEWNQLFVPSGFAHGFLTLEPDTVVLYKVSAPYAPECERAIRFDDPEIGIVWPAAGGDFILSEKDRSAPLLSKIADAL